MFNTPSAVKLPWSAHKGVVSSVSDANRKEGKHYYNVRIDLEGREGGEDAAIWFVFSPEMMSPEWKPSEHVPDPDIPKGESAENDRKRADNFVYSRNVLAAPGQRGGRALLENLLGDDLDAARTIIRQAHEAGNLTAQVVAEMLQAFLDGKAFLYLMGQQTEYNSDTGETIFLDREEIKDIQRLTDASLARMVKRIERTAGKANAIIPMFDMEAVAA